MTKATCRPESSEMVHNPQDESLSSSRLFKSSAPFSHWVMRDGIGFVSGIIVQDPATGRLVSEDICAQFVRALDNLQMLLDEARLSWTDVVRTTVYLTDYARFDELNDIYAGRFHAPFPARTTVGVAALPLNSKVQLDATAIPIGGPQRR